MLWGRIRVMRSRLAEEINGHPAYYNTVKIQQAYETSIPVLGLYYESMQPFLRHGPMVP